MPGKDHVAATAPDCQVRPRRLYAWTESFTGPDLVANIVDELREVVADVPNGSETGQQSYFCVLGGCPGVIGIRQPVVNGIVTGSFWNVREMNMGVNKPWQAGVLAQIEVRQVRGWLNIARIDTLESSITDNDEAVFSGVVSQTIDQCAATDSNATAVSDEGNGRE